MAPILDRYRGEFRYVLYAQPGRYDETIAFYRDALGFPVVGGFSGGTYFQASTGIIEIIDPEAEDDGLKDIVFRGHEQSAPAQGAFLLVEVAEVDELARRLKGRGVSLLQDPYDWPWQFRDLKVTDPCGTIVCLFSRLPGWEDFHGESVNVDIGSDLQGG